MPGIYPFPEFDDVVYGYLVEAYRSKGKPVDSGLITHLMNRDVPGVSHKEGVAEALKSLEERFLIKRIKRGYIPLDRASALRRQLELEGVEPFTREYGEVPEAHMEKVWHGDIRELQKPEAGGRYGLYPTIQYSAEEKVWKGLTREE